VLCDVIAWPNFVEDIKQRAGAQQGDLLVASYFGMELVGKKADIGDGLIPLRQLFRPAYQLFANQ